MKPNKALPLKINLQKAVRAAHLPSLENFSQWLMAAINYLSPPISSEQAAIVIRLINQRESAYLNETFRHKKGPTNVIAFVDKPLGGLLPDTLGDLAICAAIVRKEALKQKKSIISHWAHLTIHGFLHLLGYDHLSSPQARIMEAHEIAILTTLGFNNPYEENR